MLAGTTVSGAFTWKSSWLHNRFRATFHVVLQNWGLQLLHSQGITPSTITIARRPKNRKRTVRAIASHCLWHAEHMFSVQHQQVDQDQCRTTDAYLQLIQHGQREKRLTLLLSRILLGPVLALRSKEYLRCYRNVKCPLIMLMINCSICYILFSYKLNLYWCSSYRNYSISCTVYSIPV